MEDKSLNYIFHDILDKVLHLSDNPAQFADFLTLQIRELIGARTIIIAVKTETDLTEIFSIYPERKRDWCNEMPIKDLIELSFLENDVQIWDENTLNKNVQKNIGELGIDKSIIIPLVTGKRVVGSILLLDIMDMYGIDALLDLLKELSGVFALIIRNSLLYFNLESLVASKTKELNTRNEELSESEKKFRAVFENSVIGMSLTTLEGKMNPNKAFCQMVGYSKEELSELTWKELSHKDDIERGFKAVQTVLNSDSESFSIEHRFIHKNGEIVWVDISSTLQYDSDHNPVSFITTINNITERKQIEIALKESEKKYHRITDNISDVVWTSDLQLNISYVSPSVERLLGLTEEQHLNRTQEHKFPPESLLILQKGLLEEMEKENNPAFEKNRSRAFEVEYFRADGTRIWVEISVSFLRDELGRPIGLQGMTRDISDRRRAERELLASEERYRLISSVVSDYIFTSTIDENNALKLSWVGGAFERITGYTYEEYIQAGGWRGTMHPDDLAKDNQDISQLRKNKQVVTDIRTIAKDGRLVWVRVYAHPVWDTERNLLIGIYGGVKDITESVLTEKAMHESEEKFRKAFFTSPESITITSIETGVYKEVNKGFTHTLGYDAKDVVGRKSIELDIWYEVSDRVHVVNELKSKGVVENYICRFRKKDGEIIYGMLSASVIELDGEKHILLITRDITRIKTVENALKETNERLNVILESTPIAIWDWDVTTDKWYATSKYYTMLGYEVENDYPDRQVWMNRIHPDDRQMVAGKISKVLNHSDENYNYEARMLHADGSYRWQTVIGQVVEHDKDNKASRLIGVRIDIHDRKKAELALRESEQKLSALFSSMTEMVVMHELVFDESNNVIDYQFVDCNNAFIKMLGVSKNEVVGKLASRFYETLKAPYLKNYAAVALTNRTFQHTVYYEKIDKYLLISVISTGKNLFSTIITDITDLKKMNEVISAKNKELENYLYVASHDLRSPLVNIQGFSERLQRQTGEIATLLDSQTTEQPKLAKLTGDDIPKSIKFILTNVQKMDTLINGLLQLSRTGRITMNVTKVNMNELIHTVLSQYNFELTEYKVNLHLGKMLDCYGDKNQLNQLFSNIISNALKYRGKSRNLDIEITSKQNYSKVIYSIKDTGIGINARHLEKIWDVFYRVDASNPEAGEGLGLSLAKRIVEKHKGKVWVESVEGNGSTFFVELQMTEFES